MWMFFFVCRCISHLCPLCGASCLYPPPILVYGNISQTHSVRLLSKNERVTAVCSDHLRQTFEPVFSPRRSVRNTDICSCGGVASVVLRTSCSYSLPWLQRRRQKHEGAFRDTRSVFVYCTSWCRGLGGGRNGGAIFPCSAVSPLIIPTPFCTQCYAVEHENKNILSQDFQVSQHKLVRGFP